MFATESHALVFFCFFFCLVFPLLACSLHVRIVELVQNVVSVLLLPLYFAVSGLKTDLTLLDSATRSHFFLFFFCLVSPLLACSLHVRIVELVQDVVSVLLLPLYFAVSGLKTDLTLLDNATSWGICVLTILAACLGGYL